MPFFSLMKPLKILQQQHTISYHYLQWILCLKINLFLPFGWIVLLFCTSVTTSSIVRKMNTIEDRNILEPLMMKFYHFRKEIYTMFFKSLMLEDPPFVALITEVSLDAIFSTLNLVKPCKFWQIFVFEKIDWHILGFYSIWFLITLNH